MTGWRVTIDHRRRQQRGGIFSGASSTDDAEDPTLSKMANQPATYQEGLRQGKSNHDPDDTQTSEGGSNCC
jgi:hypothetical protein